MKINMRRDLDPKMWETKVSPFFSTYGNSTSGKGRVAWCRCCGGQGSRFLCRRQERHQSKETWKDDCYKDGIR